MSLSLKDNGADISNNHAHEEVEIDLKVISPFVKVIHPSVFIEQQLRAQCQTKHQHNKDPATQDPSGQGGNEIIEYANEVRVEGLALLNDK